MLYKFFVLVICIFFLHTTQSSAQDYSKYGIDSISSSSIHALSEGTNAPEFNAKDQNGNRISLSKLLKSGPLVLVFYRGEWCSYCNRTLAEYESELSTLTDAGAQIIAVTPESYENRDLTIEKSNISFPVIVDEDLSIMKNYGVAFNVTEDYQNKLFKYTSKNITDMNYLSQAVLPIPATYIIGQDKKIKWTHFDPDYSKRATVEEILEVLAKL